MSHVGLLKGFVVSWNKFIKLILYILKKTIKLQNCLEYSFEYDPYGASKRDTRVFMRYMKS